MGTVWLAEHTLLGRKAAIKVLLPTLSADTEIVQRFFNEAKAVTTVTDPGIVQVFDFGNDATGNAYIVMELLDGETVAERVERTGPIATRDVVRLMRLICVSLAVAHDKGIVHRDLKPENIFIVADPAVPSGERAKIVDFGIAKLSRDEGTHITHAGAMLGTPLYMSPEQCRGAGDIDHRSDIYSIACVMVMMLTGKPPFDGDGTGDLIVAHLQQPPPRLTNVPAAVDLVVQRCLAKDPDDRYQTMTDLAAALGLVEEQLQDDSFAGRASYAASATTAEAAHTVASRPRSRGAMIGGIAAFALVAGIAGIVLATNGGDTHASPPADAMIPITTVTKTEITFQGPRDAATPDASESVAAAVDAAMTASTPVIDAPPVIPTPHLKKTTGGSHVKKPPPTPTSAATVDRGD
jgi:serine/threonine-protein kinase